MTIKKTLLSWSSGKDSAWTLHVLRQKSDVEVVGLMTTVNQDYQRISIHAVRVELLQRQAEAAGLPLYQIAVPYPCTNADYEAAMQRFIGQAKQVCKGVTGKREPRTMNFEHRNTLQEEEDEEGRQRKTC